VKSKLVNWFKTLRSTFWLVPSMMALAAVGLSYGPSRLCCRDQ